MHPFPKKGASILWKGYTLLLQTMDGFRMQRKNLLRKEDRDRKRIGYFRVYIHTKAGLFLNRLLYLSESERRDSNPRP